MHSRQSALTCWLQDCFNHQPFTMTPLAGDASFRHYFRIQHGKNTYVLMDAPPTKEAVTPFITIAKQLSEMNIHVPTVYEADVAQGFLLLEDLGDDLLLHALSPMTANYFYQQAMHPLQRMQQCPNNSLELPMFNSAHIAQELALFPQWFLHQYLGLNFNQEDNAVLDLTFGEISNELLQQPQIFIHRDYHSRNLLILKPGSRHTLGVIDFQDAMAGPFTYDLVSLLKDCYIKWPRAQVLDWVEQFYKNLPNNYGLSLSEFIQAFDVCGLQRHLKVLGIFCRLHLRDQKSGYLQYLTHTFNSVLECLQHYPKLYAFQQFLVHKVCPSFKEKQQ